jgi:hypothetical protein
MGKLRETLGLFQTVINSDEELEAWYFSQMQEFAVK